MANRFPEERPAVTTYLAPKQLRFGIQKVSHTFDVAAANESQHFIGELWHESAAAHAL